MLSNERRCQFWQNEQKIDKSKFLSSFIPVSLKKAIRRLFAKLAKPFSYLLPQLFMAICPDLKKRGLILRDPTKPRAIELTSSGLEKIDVQPASIPMLGVVTAGEPILAVEDASDFFPIPPDLANSTGSLFMLTIRGESMINAGILDGDQVIVRKQQSAQNGDIVIAMTDEDEATCKRFYKEKNYIRLQPENDYLEPIILPDVTILGLVVGLYRHLL